MIYALCRQIFSKIHPKTLLIGFSGGADSTALLEIVRDLQPEFGYAFTAIHFNHHLRGAESDLEAQNARRFAAERALDFCLVDLKIPENENLESAARKARLDAWQNLVREYRADAILLAHHADDKLENLLIRLSRGANASGATSLRAVSELGGICFVRPLLDLSKPKILEFLARRGITKFAEDSSNADCRFFRNRLRHEILPALYAASPGGREGFLAALEALEKDARFAENAAENYFSAGDPGQPEFWRNAPDALRHRLLRRWIYCRTGRDFIPTGGDCRRLNEELKKEKSELCRITLSGGITLVLTHDTLDLELPDPPQCQWDWKKEKQILWGNWQLAVIPDDGSPCPPDEARFDEKTLPCPLVVSVATPGETMIPFGWASQEKLKKLRIDRKKSAFPPLPVLRDETGNVLWFAGVRQSSSCAVTEKSCQTVRFSLQESPFFQHENSADRK